MRAPSGETAGSVAWVERGIVEMRMRRVSAIGIAAAPARFDEHPLWASRGVECGFDDGNGNNSHCRHCWLSPTCRNRRTKRWPMRCLA